jgi:hypothetical protein
MCSVGLNLASLGDRRFSIPDQSGHLFSAQDGIPAVSHAVHLNR